MNSITFTDHATYLTALNSLEMTATPEYVSDEDTLTISSEEIHDIIDLLMEDGIEDFTAQIEAAEPFDGFLSDAEADGDALASAGMGTDEDYGYYGDSDGGYDE